MKKKGVNAKKFLKKRSNNLIYWAIILIVIIIIGAVFIFAGFAYTGDAIKMTIVKKTGKCSDSDGGPNYNIKGICRDGKQVIADKCLSSKILSESYCNYDKSKCVVDSASCKYGCVNGACKSGK